MLSSLKLLQKERMMWQVLSQEAELRCDDAQFEIHRQKLNGRTLVQTQVWIRPLGKSVSSRNSCGAVAQGTKSKACCHKIIEALEEGRHQQEQQNYQVTSTVKCVEG